MTGDVTCPSSFAYLKFLTKSPSTLGDPVLGVSGEPHMDLWLSAWSAVLSVHTQWASNCPVLSMAGSTLGCNSSAPPCMAGSKSGGSMWESEVETDKRDVLSFCFREVPQHCQGIIPTCKELREGLSFPYCLLSQWYRILEMKLSESARHPTNS